MTVGVANARVLGYGRAMTNQGTPNTSKIEQAVDALLRALIERPAPAHRAEHVVSAADIDQTDDGEDDLNAIIADPIGSACRSEIASLGGFLFETLGTMDEISMVTNRIAAMDDANKARRTAILEECWETIDLEDDEDGA